MGRVREIRWGPRTIDVDILWYHGFSSAEACLEVPHPRMEQRRFVLERHRQYWVNEHVTARILSYRLAYSSLTRQYRLTTGNLHQNFGSLAEAMRVVGRIAALPVVDKDAIKPGESYEAAVRLALDRSQLPKPFQVDAITDRDLHVETKPLRWQFVAPPGTP